jgi:hypothetical protein
VTEQVQPSFDDSGVADRYLHSLSQSLPKPSLPLFGWYVGRQHRHAHALSRENVRQPRGDIALSSIHCVHVAAAAARLQFGRYDFDEPSLLGIQELLIQILRLGNLESLPPLRFRIILVAIQSPMFQG